MFTLTRLASFVLVMVLLSGCFLSQTEPPPKLLSSKSPVGGEVYMQEIRAADVIEAGIDADIYREEKPRPQGIVGFELADSNLLFGSLGRLMALTSIRWQTSERDAECVVGDIPVTREDAKVSPISVGRMIFGQALQSAALEIPKDENQHYSLKLEPDVPPGTYGVEATGTSDAEGFSEILVMPPAILDPEVNRVGFQEAGMSISKSAPLSVQWRSLALPLSTSIMEFQLSVRDSEATHVLICRRAEESISSQGGISEWILPQSYLQSFVTGSFARVVLSRRVTTASNRAVIWTLFSGQRIWLQIAPIEP